MALGVRQLHGRFGGSFAKLSDLIHCHLLVCAAGHEQDDPETLEVDADSGVVYGGAIGRNVRLATSLSPGKDYSIWMSCMCGLAYT